VLQDSVQGARHASSLRPIGSGHDCAWRRAPHASCSCVMPYCSSFL
jgi:hypothetical protein